MGAGLLVLAVTPLYLEAGLLHVVGHILLTVDGILVTGKEGAAVAVAFAVVRSSREPPRPLGVDFAEQLQVHLVVDGKVVAAVAQVEAALHLVAIGGHDEARGIALGEREETVGNSQRQRYVAHNEVGGTEDHVLAWAHLSTRQGDVEVGVGFVASGVAAVLQEELTRGAALRQFGGQITVLLLRIDLRDKTFLGLEVESHRVTLVLVATHLEYGSAKFMAQGVERACGMNQRRVEHHEDAVALEVHILILYMRFAIQKGSARAGLVGQRVIGRVLYGSVDAVLALAVQTVERQRVINQLVVLVDSQFQRVHCGGVALHFGGSWSSVSKVVSTCGNNRVGGCSNSGGVCSYGVSSCFNCIGRYFSGSTVGRHLALFQQFLRLSGSLISYTAQVVILDKRLCLLHHLLSLVKKR